jgi:hypothetical protein
MSKVKHSISKARETVAPNELPSRCRTWDARRRAWVPKLRYDDAATAREVIGKDRTKVSYKCGDHWHVGGKGGNR